MEKEARVKSSNGIWRTSLYEAGAFPLNLLSIPIMGNLSSSLGYGKTPQSTAVAALSLIVFTVSVECVLRRWPNFSDRATSEPKGWSLDAFFKYFSLITIFGLLVRVPTSTKGVSEFCQGVAGIAAGLWFFYSLCQSYESGGKGRSVAKAIFLFLFGASMLLIAVCIHSIRE